MTDAANDRIVVPRARFVVSASDYRSLPPAEAGEYCLLGRSNVGKSSFLNHLFADKSLARVSSKPGKTVLVNLFSIQSGETWADLPGYGYAKAGKSEQKRMSQLLTDYCSNRDGLKGIIWLLDSRHPGTAADTETAQWLLGRGLPVLTVLTKCDKLSKNEVARSAAAYAKALLVPQPIVPYSINEQKPREVFWRAYLAWRQQGVQA